MSMHFWILVYFLYFVGHIRLAPDQECKGVRCYNGGRFEYRDSYCACICPSGFSGLLCEYELYESDWPDGPYALLMPKAGCPESASRGWSLGYVDVTTFLPFTTWRFTSDVTGGEHNYTEIVITEGGTNLKGIFKQNYFRLNFCFKQADHIRFHKTDWPMGDYIIFGAAGGCPAGFLEEAHTFNLPPVKSWSSDGELPFIRINRTHGTMETLFCKRTMGGLSFPDDWSTFVFMKPLGTACADQNNSFSVIDETLVFVNSAESLDSTNAYLSYCHYWNPYKAYLFTCEDGEFDCGLGHCIPMSSICDGVATCAGGADEIDEGCSRKCSEVEFHCGGGMCIFKDSVCDHKEDCLDGRDELSESCHHKCFEYMRVCDGGDYCIPDLYLCDLYPDCLDGTDEDFSLCFTDAEICMDEEISCSKRSCIDLPICNVTDECPRSWIDEDLCPSTTGSNHFMSCGDGQCVASFMACDGNRDCSNGADELISNCNAQCIYEYKYFCVEEECITGEDLCDQMYRCASEQNTKGQNQGGHVICLDDMGLADGTIKDFQISASSWTSTNPPQMVRPTLDSWCPAAGDRGPFLQVDLYAPVVIGGLVIYNKGDTQGMTENQVYQEIRVFLGCQAFSVSYAMFSDTFREYNEEPFEIDLARKFSEPQHFYFLRPFLARYIRVYPQNALSTGILCARFELLGCSNPGQLSDECSVQTDIFWVLYSLLQPYSAPKTILPFVHDINSTTDCKKMCVQDFSDRCMAIKYIENVECDIYPRSDGGIQYTKIIGVAEMKWPTLHLMVCWINSEKEYIQPKSHSRFQRVKANPHIVISSAGYPFSYPSDTDFFWSVTGSQDSYLIVTFVDIYLSETLEFQGSKCDIIAIEQGTEYPKIDSRYNGHVVSIPIAFSDVVIKFKTCPRHIRKNSIGRGFRSICRQTYRPVLTSGHIPRHIGTEYIAYSLVGVFTKNIQWLNAQIFDSQRYNEPFMIITFHYFNVPCNEGIIFRMSDVLYCNNNKPRQHFWTDNHFVKFSFSGNLSSIFVEGFSYSIVVTDFVYQHERLVSTSVCSHDLRKCYIYFESQNERSWMFDANTCHGLGYTLLNLHQRTEMEFVVSLITQYTSLITGERLDRVLPKMLNAYIGLRRYMGRNGQEQIWEDGTRVSFTQWGSGEPADGFLKLCTEMVIVTPTLKTHWRTVACHEISPASNYVIICEKNQDTAPIEMRTFALENGTRPLAESEGRSILFLCQGGEWVHSIAVCDGMADCADSSDEVSCDREIQDGCTDEEFMCTDGTCIQLDQVCNHVIDCSPQGTDEFCDLPRCQDDEFQCENTQCVPNYSRCDSVPDCLDMSDEIGCVSCNETNSFLCGDLTCIHESRVCDRYRDCIDGRDEQGCDPPFTTCYNLWMEGTETNVTFRATFRDEEVTIECVFYVDEENLLTVTTNVHIDTTWNVTTDLSEFEKNHHQYVPTSDFKMHGKMCQQEITHACLKSMMEVAIYYDPHFNGSYRHCSPETTTVTFTFTDGCENITYAPIKADGEERFFVFVYCHSYAVAPAILDPQITTVGPISCHSVYQQTDEIRCDKGRRVPSSRRCLYDVGRTGSVDGCRDYKHLDNCVTFECPQGYVKCPNSFCVANMYICDGERQCPRGEDEYNCWCTNRTSSMSVIFHGSTDDRTRSYIFRFARQFFSNNHELQAVNFYKSTDTLYTVTRRRVHQFSEILNKETTETAHVKGNGIVNIAADMHGNGSQLIIIYIEDDFTSRLLSSAQVLTNPNIEKLYRITLGIDIDAIFTTTERTELETDIFVNNWDKLGSTGSVIFPDICPGYNKSDCFGQYKCSSSRICIPVHQVCDGKKQCPFDDDEDMCDFNCLEKCSCHRYIADCSRTNFTVFQIEHLSATTRKLDISNNDISTDGIFVIPKPFPQLLKLNASSCKIRLIKDYTFNMTVHLLYLEMSYNKIRSIQRYAFDKLAKLRELRLDGNFEIRSIDQYAFMGMNSLTKLIIRNTKITEILPDTFAGLTIDVLDISNNRISKIHGRALNDLSVAELRIDGNELQYFDTNIFAGIRSLERLITPAFKFCCYKPSSLPEERCLPEKDEFSSCEDLMRNSALQTLLWILGIAALIGNACAIIYRVLYDRQRLKHGFGMFVTNLAASDFLMGVFMITIAIADLSFRNRYIEMEDYWKSSGWCTFAGIMATVSSETSVLFLCLITIDRLLVIKFPFGQFRFDIRKASVLTICSWIFSWAVAILPVLYTNYFQDRFYSTTGVCIALPLTRHRPPGWLYSFLIFICLNFLTFLLIAVGQLMIYLEIHQNSKRMSKVTSKRRNDLKIARNLFLVLMTDFLCWFPIGVMGILAFRGNEISGDVYAWTAVLILPINSALNPFLYTLTAIIGHKKFNPRIDEQTLPKRHDIGGKLIKLLNSNAIASMVAVDYDNLDDLLPGSVYMTPREILAITMSLFQTLNYLHDLGLIHGNIDANYVLINRRMEGKVSLQIRPQRVRTKGRKEKDIYDLGKVTKYLLCLLRTT